MHTYRRGGRHLNIHGEVELFAERPTWNSVCQRANGNILVGQQWNDIKSLLEGVSFLISPKRGMEMMSATAKPPHITPTAPGKPANVRTKPRSSVMNTCDELHVSD